MAKAVHDHAALRQPVAALGQQDAGSAAQFGRDIGRHGGAAEGVGPRTQYLADRRAVRQHHHLPAADAGPEYRAIAPAPLFHGLVDGAGLSWCALPRNGSAGGAGKSAISRETGMAAVFMRLPRWLAGDAGSIVCPVRQVLNVCRARYNAGMTPPDAICPPTVARLVAPAWRWLPAYGPGWYAAP